MSMARMGLLALAITWAAASRAPMRLGLAVSRAAASRADLLPVHGLGEPGGEQVHDLPGGVGHGLEVPAPVEGGDLAVCELLLEVEFGDAAVVDFVRLTRGVLGEDQRLEGV